MKRYQIYDYCVWDFNGTLLDDVGTGIKSVNTLLGARGLAQIESVEKYHSVFGFPIIDYYRSLGFDFEKEPYETVAKQWVSLYMENVKDAPLCAYARELIDFFEEHGIGQIILSATELNMLCGQLEVLGIRDKFCDVLGLDNIYASSKLTLARRLREKYPTARLLLIGDTDHDAVSARELGADCVIVAAGHQSKEYLKSKGYNVFDSLEDLKDKFLTEEIF